MPPHGVVPERSSAPAEDRHAAVLLRLANLWCEDPAPADALDIAGTEVRAMGEQSVQELNRRRICLPSREITSQGLFSAKAAEISRNLWGIDASEVTSMSASLGPRDQITHARRSSGSPKYNWPVLRRDLKRSKFSIFDKKTSTE